jgi:peptidoglycan-associated lipoprotein
MTMSIQCSGRPGRMAQAVLASLAVLALVGCGSTVKLDETPIESRTPKAIETSPGATASGNGAAGTSGTSAQSQVATVDLSKGGVASRGAAGSTGGATGAAAADGKLGRVVYFDYDSFGVKDDFRALIEGHAKVLAANKGKRVVIEGHTDERGGREYNLALGQKRADAVAKAMVLLGATEAQIEAVSFGKERPANEGHDEAAWAQNRRAEVKDR